MTRERTAGVCLWIVFTSGTIIAQQNGGTTSQAVSTPTSRVVEVTYPLGGVAPSRRVQTRSESGGRETVIETVESPGVDGRFEPLQQTVTETVRAGTDMSQTKRDLFGFGARQRRLLETVQEERKTSAGNTSAVRSTWLPDVDGRLRFQSRQVEETSSIGPSTQQTDTVTLVAGINEAVSESERTQYTARTAGPGVMRHESVQLLRNLNRGWQTTEARNGETRDAGPTERVTEETVQRLDANGRLAVAERSYTRRSEVNGKEHVDIETYSDSAEGFVRSNSRLTLSQRVRRTTTVASDGGREIVEEVEGRNRAAPNDPMRVIRRTVTTVRMIGLDRWVRQTQVFELDANGRMVPVFGETEETDRR
jgi:hypothetical protein